MRIPSRLLPHRITVEHYLGPGAEGPLYGPPVTVRCLLTRGSTRVETSAGRRTVDETTAVCEPTSAARRITAEARVTVDGRLAEVVRVTDHNAPGLPTPDHVEVAVR